jgi:hypothetical protein
MTSRDDEMAGNPGPVVVGGESMHVQLRAAPREMYEAKCPRDSNPR